MKKEELISLIDECEDLIKKMFNDEELAIVTLADLKSKAEEGNARAVIKVGIIAGLLEDELDKLKELK